MIRARACLLVLVVLSSGCGARAAAPASGLAGGCGSSPPDLRPLYSLPFTVGESYELTQGNCGTASHGGRFRYSFDFRMPPGTPITSARDGVVWTVRDDRPDSTGQVGDENFVIVEHPDGQFSRYIHLARGGAWVTRGDRVRAGDTLGLSGHSGRSAFPHLHFDVAIRCRPGPCRTVPAAFRNARPPIPDERRRYEARPVEAFRPGRTEAYPPRGTSSPAAARARARPPVRAAGRRIRR